MLSNLKKIDKVSVEQFGGGFVYVRSLSMAEVRKIRDENKDAWQQTQALVAQAVCNEAGEPYATVEEIDNLPLAVVNYLADKAVAFGNEDDTKKK